nr:PREDICTED: classical arabinogalactan protein 9-like [Linepithema humile]
MSSSWELFNEIEILLDECLKLETTTPSPLTRAVPRMGTSVQRSDVQNRHQAEFLVSSPPSPPKVRKEQPTAVPTNAVRLLPAVATRPPPAVATQPTPAAATQPTPAAVAPPAPAAASPAPATASRPPPPPPAAYSRPTLPSPIMVEYAPGQFAPIPYFSAILGPLLDSEHPILRVYS